MTSAPATRAPQPRTRSGASLQRKKVPDQARDSATPGHTR